MPRYIRSEISVPVWLSLAISAVLLALGIVVLGAFAKTVYALFMFGWRLF